MTAEILSTTLEQGLVRVVFRIVADDGVVYGPFVEDRPAGEDHQTFAESHIPFIEASRNRLQPTEEKILRETLREFSDAAIEAVIGVSKEELLKEQSDGDALR